MDGGASDRLVLIEHWREQGVTCPCGQLLDSNHVTCNASFNGKVGVDIRMCSYNENLSYKTKQDCVACMESMYGSHGKRLSHTANCLLCDKQ